MTRPPAYRARMVKNTLSNRSPVRCPIYDRHIATSTGIP